MKGGLPVGDPRTKQVVINLRAFGGLIEPALHERGCAGFQTVVSEGHGAFPRYTWVCFLPRAQRVVEGVYAGICFDGRGAGALAGCMTSVTRSAGQLRTQTRSDTQKIDVGNFNHAFANPKEIPLAAFDMDDLIQHLVESLKIAHEVLERGSDEGVGNAEKLAISLPFGALALLAKPFLILTGNSGTGKTKLAEKFAETFRNSEDTAMATNSAVVAVGADWTDNRSVVGFVNHLREATLKDKTEKRPVYQSTPVLDLLLHADGNPTCPHFLILDEMNLSHVERYFADFLSAMEARDGVIRLHSEGVATERHFQLPRFEGDHIGVPRQLPYPKNLFVIGTVNVDETTYMFSPKVLDRAHVIEFEVDPDAVRRFLDDPKPLEPAPRASEAEAAGFLELGKTARNLGGRSLDPLPPPVAENINGHLIDVLKILQRARFEYAFRTANEVNTYLRVCRHLSAEKAAWDADVELSEADRKSGMSNWRSDLDDEILQKILPRLHGSRSRVGNLVGALVCYFATAEEGEAMKFFPPEGQEEAVKTLTDAVTMPAEGAKFPRCLRKVHTMARVLVEEQFVSFIC